MNFKSIKAINLMTQKEIVDYSLQHYNLSMDELDRLLTTNIYAKINGSYSDPLFICKLVQIAKFDLFSLNERAKAYFDELCNMGFSCSDIAEFTNIPELEIVDIIENENIIYKYDKYLLLIKIICILNFIRQNLYKTLKSKLGLDDISFSKYLNSHPKLLFEPIFNSLAEKDLFTTLKYYSQQSIAEEFIKDLITKLITADISIEIIAKFANISAKSIDNFLQDSNSIDYNKKFSLAITVYLLQNIRSQSD